jgi:3-phytase
MSRYWGNLSPYHPADGFGVNDSDIPSDCEVSQVHILHRHGQRFPTAALDDGGNTQRFADKVRNASINGILGATGPLTFLNEYQYRLGLNTLTAIGVQTEISAGSTFWTQYGRLLYKEMNGSWNDSLNVFPNGTARPKPFLRTTSEERIYESAICWASGFFNNSDGGSSNTSYDLLIIPEGEIVNNTLASYDSCPNSGDTIIGYIGNTAQAVFYNNYLQSALERLSTYLDRKFNLIIMDVYAMQTICPYEVAYLGSSNFCGLFTEQEWIDFDYSLSIQFYGDNSFGNPTGRAQGIGYVQELLARLQNQYLYVSNTSVNSTLDNNPTTFPLGQPFYLDMSHDDIIVSTLTALGLNYFKGPPTGLPYNISHAPNSSENFQISEIAPFGARLYTEVLECSTSNPKSETSNETIIYSNPNITYGWKFIRMQLNEKTLPLHTLGCPFRSDGLCSLEDFLATQMTSTADAQYSAACFGNYVISSQVSNGNLPSVSKSTLFKTKKWLFLCSLIISFFFVE